MRLEAGEEGDVLEVAFLVGDVFACVSVEGRALVQTRRAGGSEGRCTLCGSDIQTEPCHWGDNRIVRALWKRP